MTDLPFTNDVGYTRIFALRNLSFMLRNLLS